MKRKPARTTAGAESQARLQGQISALIDDLAGAKARLDELESWRKSTERQAAETASRLDALEVVRVPSVTTTEPDPAEPQKPETE